MKFISRWRGRKFSRHLYAMAIVFVVMFLYREIALPHFPVLDTRLGGVLVAGVIAAAAWWIVSRGSSSR